MKGELSENDLRYKAEAYCSLMERCVADVEAKLSQWGATPEMMEKIVRHCRMRDTLTRSVFARLLFAINIALTNGAE